MASSPDSLTQASGVPPKSGRAALLVLTPSGQRSRVAIESLPFQIGRQADSNLVLRDNRASRAHAQISWDGGQFVLEDLDSRHGTWLNGQRITSHRLRSGDLIDFGVADSYQLTFTIEHPESGNAEANQALRRIVSASGSGGESEHAESAALVKLRNVVEVARALQNSLSTREVLTAVTDAALNVTGCERGFLLLRKGDDLEIAVARDRNGTTLDSGDLHVSTTVIQRALNSRRELLSMQFDPAEEAGMRPDTSIAALELRSVVCLPLIEIRSAQGDETQITSTARATVGLIYMDSRVSEASLTAMDRELLQTLAIEASTILENARLIEEERDKQRMSSELMVARGIQQDLVPVNLPSEGWLRISGSTWPSAEVGGDYFDARMLSPDRWSAIVADVSGKGVSSALLAGILQGAFLMAGNGPDHMQQTLRDLNGFLLERMAGEKYATVFYGMIDRVAGDPASPEGVLRYINAGHCSPVLVTREGKLATLHPTGMPVGMLAEGIFEAAERKLRAGDKVVIFSDGLTEAADAAGEFYGIQRLRLFLREHGGLGAAELRESLLAELEQFTTGGGFHDDITVLVLEYQPADAEI